MYYDEPAFGPIRDLLADPSVTEIMIVGVDKLYAEKGGRMLEVPRRFKDDRQLNFLVNRMLEPTRRAVSTSHPFVDFRLPDGSRVNITIPPISLVGTLVTIRKFTRSLSTLDDLVAAGTISKKMASLLVAGVKGRLNIIFSGATGSGKTTTLGILSNFISPDERIITIEDTAELQLQQKHVVAMETRRANVEGRGEVQMADLLTNSLRMRPTRIIVGEVRGPEAFDMLQAILSGHQGCMAVLHASNPIDAASRLEMMSMSGRLQLPVWVIRKQIAAAVDLIVQHEIRPCGGRKITFISEVSGVDTEGNVEIKDLFVYRREGTGKDGREVGSWAPTGVKPGFLEKCARMGVALPDDIFT